MTDTDNTVTHTTVCRYKYSGPETHGHTSYDEALGFAQSRAKVNGVGQVSVQINRIDDGHDVWIETIGGIR